MYWRWQRRIPANFLAPFGQDVAIEAMGKEHMSTLELDWSESLGHRCVIKVTPWDQGLGAVAIDENEASGISLQQLGDWLFRHSDNAIAAWRSTFPDDVERALASLPSHQALAAEIAVKSTASLDLLVSNPLLFWALCDRGDFAKSPITLIEKTCQQKQRVLCGRLGLAGTKQQIKLLKRAKTVGLSKDELRSYLQLLKHQSVCNYLSHSRGELGYELPLLMKHPWLAGCPARALIPLLSNQEHRVIFRDTLRMIDDITELQQCTTANALNRLHDRLVVELNQWRGRELIRNEYGQPVPLPEPPLAATDNIIPITSQAELIEEGREMHHCIASHLKSVVDGKFAVYRMTAPERLTIEVLVMSGGQLVLREVRGKCNHLPSDASNSIIEAWFSKGATKP